MCCMFFESCLIFLVLTVSPVTQGPSEQPAHIPLPHLCTKVEEELSSSAHTHYHCSRFQLRLKPEPLNLVANELPFHIALHSYLYTSATYSKVQQGMAGYSPTILVLLRSAHYKHG